MDRAGAVRRRRAADIRSGRAVLRCAVAGDAARIAGDPAWWYHVDARRPAVGRRYRRRMDRRALSSAADAGGAELIPAGGRGRLWVDPDLPAGEGVMRDQRNFLIGLLVLAVGAVAGVLFAPIWGYGSERYGRRRLLLLASVI